MSARRSPVERDARQIAANTLKAARRRRLSADEAWHVLEEAVRSCERSTAWAVQRDDMPGARRQARAARLLDEAQTRLGARQARDIARVLAQAGIVPNARVVVVQAGYSTRAPAVGTVMTLDGGTETRYFLRGTDDDGREWLVYYGNVEVVPDAPIPDSRIGDETQRGGDVDDVPVIYDEPEAWPMSHVEDPADYPDPEAGDTIEDEDERERIFAAVAGGEPAAQRSEWFECDQDGCDYVIGAVGVPAFDEDPYVFDDEIREHVRGHQRDDAAVPA